jgi:hypothetical protein
MSHEDKSLSTMLASKDERIQSYLRTTRSTDDIVREVTTAFASDVARIMASTQAGSQKPRGQQSRSQRSSRK